MAKKITNIRLEEHVRKRLRAQADREGRSVSDLIREYLSKGLGLDGQKSTPPAANQ